MDRFLPPALQQRITIDLGMVRFWGNPSLLVAAALGVVAAVHSFRSTLKRYAKKTDEATLVEQDEAKQSR